MPLAALLLSCGNHVQCTAACLSSATFQLSVPAAGSSIEIWLTPDGPRTSCSNASGELTCTGGAPYTKAADDTLESVSWYYPPRKTTLGILVIVDGQVFADGEFFYDPEARNAVCGQQCYEPVRFDVR